MNSPQTFKEYLSPKHKLLHIFETGRDRWKEKCKEAKAQLKTSKTKVRRLIEQRDHWKEVATELQARVALLEGSSPTLTGTLDH